MTNFNEMMEQLASSVKTSKSGGKIKSFSKKDFESLFTAFLNEVGYETQIVAVKGGDKVTESVKPVDEFRKVFYNTLVDFGVDKQEAERILTGEYQFKKVPGAYAFTSEILEQYLINKDFTFLPKEDFAAKLSIVDVVEQTKEFRVPDSDKKVTKTIGAHRKLKSKSSAPKWLKAEIK